MGNYEVIRCEDWIDFQEKIRIHGGNPGNRKIIYRGQRDPSWELVPSLFRHLKKEFKPEIETPLGKRQVKLPGTEFAKKRYDKYLSTFKSLVKQNVNFCTDGFNDIDWLTIGRHNGLITPLLDWSQSPYIAAFFAFFDFANWANDNGFGTPCSGRGSKNGEVSIWQLKIEDEDLIGDEYNLIDHLSYHNERQKRQHGVFLHFISNEYHDLENYLEARSLTPRLSKYVIQIIHKPDDGVHHMFTPLYDLSRMGISYSTLFPDLEGCAFEANMRHGCGY